jgi:DNA-binding GntR family transcriptional regulator
MTRGARTGARARKRHRVAGAARPAVSPAAAAGARPAAPLFAEPLRHQTLEEQAYRHIRRAIVEGQLRPGQRIVAQAVARAAGISRIPVMQALRRLESDGFVRINPHRDVVVTTLSAEEFRERFLLMATLEALCVREANGRVAPPLLERLRDLHAEIVAARRHGDIARAVAADGEFHRTLWEASGLRQVAQILQNVWDRGEYYRYVMHARRGGFAAESLAEHVAILDALEARDAERAARAVETHRLRAMARLAETGPSAETP